MTSEHRAGSNVVRLEFTSVLEMVDLVQMVGDHVARQVGLDDDTVHWINVAVRESVINAIKHGNQGDTGKRVFVEFERAALSDMSELTIRVRDQGDGFDPDLLADPLAPENILKSSGRGIFLIRNFMDDVWLRRTPGGGMEIGMIKRVQLAGTSSNDPIRA
jgi:serine/threonine-protein kinase RsbW